MQGQETPCIRATSATSRAPPRPRFAALLPWWYKVLLSKDGCAAVMLVQRAVLYVGATWLRRGCRIVGCMPSSTNSQIWWDIR